MVWYGTENDLRGPDGSGFDMIPFQLSIYTDVDYTHRVNTQIEFQDDLSTSVNAKVSRKTRAQQRL
jgi:hypothetical protein